MSTRDRDEIGDAIDGLEIGPAIDYLERYVEQERTKAIEHTFRWAVAAMEQKRYVARKPLPELIAEVKKAIA